MSGLRAFLAAAMFAGLAFQVVHFLEHLVQFGVFLGGDRKAPYMSPMAMDLSVRLGEAFLGPAGSMCGPVSSVAVAKPMVMGMELLHLVGNGIFLATIAILYYFRRDRLVRYALYVEGFHLYEHVMLTLTSLFTPQALGLSTLFGGAAILGGPTFGVGYRVSWHFVMNLVPTALIMWAFMKGRLIYGMRPQPSGAAAPA